MIRHVLAISLIVVQQALLPAFHCPSWAQQPPTVALLDYHATVPAKWTSRKPSSTMRLAEYVAGAPGGAEVIVYFFGASQGGTPAASLDRWKSQFSNPSGGAVFENVTHETSPVGALTVAEYRGTYARGVGMGSAPASALPNHTLLAVVAETPKGTLFFPHTTFVTIPDLSTATPV